MGLEGILLRIAGDVQGYAYGSLLPGGAFDVMVLKGNLDFRYIWRALLRELAPWPPAPSSSTWRRTWAFPACARTS